MNKLYKSLVAIAATAIIVFVIWYFSNVIAYILISFVLALLGKPLVDLLCKVRLGKVFLPKWIAATITLIVICSLGVTACYTFVPIIVEKMNFFNGTELNALIRSFDVPLAHLDAFFRKLAPTSAHPFSIAQLLSEKIAPILNFDFLNRTFSSLTEVITSLVVALFSVTFITFFFLKDDSLFRQGVVLLFPKKYDENITRALRSINTLLVRYFIGIFIESLIKLVFITGGLVFIGLGLQDALLIALIAAILNVIPYVGPLLGGIIGLFIGAISHTGGMDPAFLWQMVILFIVFQTLDNIILQPYIYSSSVKAHPLEIFLVILLAGSMAGILGMLLAIPAYTVLRVFAKEFFNNLRVVQKLTEHI